MSERERANLRHRLATAMEKFKRSHQPPPESGKPQTGFFQIIWDHPATVAILLLLHFGLSVWFWFRIPVPGVAIAALGSAAAIMTARSGMPSWERATWTLIIFVLLGIEVRDISLDRKQQISDAAAAKILEDDRFATLLKQNQDEFEATLAKLTSLGGVTDKIRSLSTQSLEKLHEKEGALVPGNSSTPPNPCSAHTAPVYLYLGGVGVFAASLPQVIIRLNQREILAIDKDQKGNLIVSSEIFDERGDLVARIEKNKFFATPASPRIDKSDNFLRVYEHADRLALSVEFLNKNSVKIDGDMYSADGSLRLTVNDDNSVTIRMGKATIARFAPGACFGSIDICPICKNQ